MSFVMEDALFWRFGDDDVMRLRLCFARSMAFSSSSALFGSTIITHPKLGGGGGGGLSSIHGRHALGRNLYISHTIASSCITIVLSYSVHMIHSGVF